MSDSTIVTLRLPQSLVDRADSLMAHLQGDEQMLMMGRLSRSVVLRLAVLKGLELLEQQVASNSPAVAESGRRSRRR